MYCLEVVTNEFPVILWSDGDQHFETIIPNTNQARLFKQALLNRRDLYVENIDEIIANLNQQGNAAAPAPPPERIIKSRIQQVSSQIQEIDDCSNDCGKSKNSTQRSIVRKKHYTQNKTVLKKISQERYWKNREKILQKYQETNQCKYTAASFLKDINVTRSEICEICHRRLFPTSLRSVKKLKVTAVIPDFEEFPESFLACHR